MSSNNMSEVQDEELGNVDDGRREDDLPLPMSSVAAAQPNQELGTMGDDSASSAGEVMPATLAAATATYGRMLEQFDDDVGPYRLPMGESSYDKDLPSVDSNDNNKTGAPTQNESTARGVEQIDDGGIPDSGVMMTPTAAKDADKSQFAGRLRGVEQIEEGSRTGPLPFPALDSEAEGDNDMKVNKKKVILELIDDDGFPASVDYVTNVEGDTDAKIKAKSNAQASSNNGDDESIIVPTVEEMEDEVEFVTQRVPSSHPSTNQSAFIRRQHQVSSPESNAVPLDLEANVVVAGGGSTGARESVNRESSVPGITEAYAVDDNIIEATPAEPFVPWWKQRRTKVFFCMVFVIVAILSVALGASLSRDQTVTKLVALTSSPSMSAGPTMLPTTSHPSTTPSVSPSSSQVPSSSPSACSQTIITSVQKLELLGLNPNNPKVAIDGENAVAVSRDTVENQFGQLQETVMIEFYSLKDADKWERVGYLIEDFAGYGRDYDVALSGRTAVVGLPSNSVVHIYEQNIIGLWQKKDSLQSWVSSSECGFGRSVEIDGDLLVVTDDPTCQTFYNSPRLFNPLRWIDISKAPNSAQIFKRLRGNWEQFSFVTADDCFAISDCHVKGGIIALHYYNSFCGNEEDSISLYSGDGTILMQQMGSLGKRIKSIDALSENHIVYSTTSYDSGEGWVVDGLYVFYRNDPSQEFTFLQQLNASVYGIDFGSMISIDKGILVIGGGNSTHFFEEQGDNGMFKESMMFDQRYDYYHVSGRRLIVANNSDVYAMDIADCTHLTPTQTPSTSTAPTMCYVVELTINGRSGSPYKDWQASFQKIESYGVTDVKSYSSRLVEDQYEDSLCLNEGQYQFSFSSRGFDGEIQFHYNVKSNGKIIAQEGTSNPPLPTPYAGDEILHTNKFDLPLDPSKPSPPTGSPYVPSPSTIFPTYDFTASPFPTTQTPQPTTPFPTWLLPTSPQTANPTNIVSTQLPSNSESKTSTKVCLDQSKCSNQLEKKGLESFNVGEYPDYGCFMKGDKLYWGIGGTNEQMAINSLSGAKERVWC